MRYSSFLFKIMFFTMALPLLIPSLCLAWSGKVVHVADGDTITVLKSGQKAKVRLYGIDTPETKQWYGQNAKAFTSAQVMGIAGFVRCCGSKVNKVLGWPRKFQILNIYQVGDEKADHNI